MDSYTITITPNDDSGNSTTLTVDTTTGQARITSVHLHAPAGLTSGQMPSVDVGLLLQAVTGSTAPAAITATPTPAPETAPHPSPADADEPSATAAATTPEAATGDPAPNTSAAAPAKRAGRRPAGARPAENDKPRPSGTRRGRNQPAPAKPAPSKTAGKRATAAAAAPAAKSTERVYRKMPDDFAAVYRQAGATAAIADHYGVPRHTAQGWVSRYKKQETAENK
ncbi:hypothetical protein Ari01nite_95940 [Paractinoplanes rishiriensis]|uniref:Uncharacterized protein n=2 Tax=Paractinoplanes rishiriensis TaxID=1050105 RepID=A0A919N057_9ACTN|nr:hypothetical protein Ari01nite_95940 [Actinoplanes rishiriensis]